MSTSAETLTDQEIDDLISENQFYPERLVLILWDWSQGDLLGIDEPDEFQIEFLTELGRLMRSRNFNFIDAAKLIKMALGSGRGIGKSAVVGMVVVILMAAFPDCKITVTANTESQLDTKTWAEIRAWLQASIVAHWFDDNANFIRRIGAEQTWFAAKTVWNSDRPQAFAGQHNRKSLNVVIFDEASTIPHVIWDVTIGGLKTGLPIFMAFGNLTLHAGDFVDAINGKGIEFDYHKSIDARTCRFPNKETIADEVKEYGEDSDYVRVWIRGLAPRGSMSGYFEESVIDSARLARPRGVATDALLAAVDFAWGGDDDNTVTFGEGLDTWSIKPITVPGRETARPEKMIQVLADVMTRNWTVTSGGTKRVAMLFGDGSGICTEVFAGLYSLGITNVMAVNWAGVPRNEAIDKNIKAQIMRGLREAMLNGLGIPDDDDLIADMRDLVPIKFLPLQFEKKELMKKRRVKDRVRGGKSSDRLDSLAMLNYMPVVLPDVQREAAGWKKQPKRPQPRVGSWMG